MKIRNFLKQNIGVFLTALSFLALVIITTTASRVVAMHTVVLLIISPIFIVWKKLSINIKETDKLSLFMGIVSTIYLSIAFYERWKTFSKLKVVETLLHIPRGIFVLTATLFLSVFVAYFLIGMFHKLRTTLSELKQNHPVKKDLLCFMIVSFAVVFIGQIMLGLDILSMAWFRFLWNVLIVFVSQLLIYCLVGKVQISAILGTLAFMLIPTVSRYVYNFRARLFEPADFLSIGTAMNVADNYSLFPVPFDIVAGWVLWIMLILGIFKVCSGEKRKPSRKSRLKILACCTLSIALIFGYVLCLHTYHWEKQGAQFNGCSLDFISKLKEISTNEPKEYSHKAVSDLSKKYKENSTNDNTSKKQPHIIVIMDEAFSDLSILGDVSTNKEVAPFISSLKQDTISGYALASIF